MTNPSCIRTTYRIQVTTQCTCSAYKFPHALGYDLCKSSLSEKPKFQKPKRGIAHDLADFLDQFEDFIDSSTDSSLDSIIKKYEKLKKSLRDT